ncbi:MAG: hypothetical protein ACREBF_00935 [Candidatus Micrarchaeales archaeon]
MASAKITPMKIKRLPLEKNAKAAIIVVLLITIAMWLSALFYYPISSNQKLIILPLIYTVIIAFVLLIICFRYPLLERYPYLLNLPSFVYRLGLDKNTTAHAQIINRVFTVWCVAALGLSVIYSGVVYLLFSTSNQGAMAGVLVSFILIVLALMLITIFALYRSIYRSFAK